MRYFGAQDRMEAKAKSDSLAVPTKAEVTDSSPCGALSEREIDAKVAEKVMGFELVLQPGSQVYEQREEAIRVGGVVKMPIKYRRWKELVTRPPHYTLKKPHNQTHSLPFFSTDLNTCADAEARCVVQVGGKYLKALAVLSHPALSAGHSDLIEYTDEDEFRSCSPSIYLPGLDAMVRATAHQRCLAMLACMEEE